MNRPSSFFWQGSLIVLPVLLLAMAAIVLLIQDRRTVELDARADAEIAARDLAGIVAAELPIRLAATAAEVPNQGGGQPHLVWREGTRVNNDGSLLSVGPHRAPARLSAPREVSRFNLDRLDEQAASLWQAARTAEIQNEMEAPDAYQRFLALDPPEPFFSNARYTQALLLANHGEIPKALELLTSLGKTRERTETGSRLAVLSRFQRLKLRLSLQEDAPDALAKIRTVAEELATSARSDPSLTTEPLLRTARDLVRDFDDVSASFLQAALTALAIDQNTRDFHQKIEPLLANDSPDGERAFWNHWAKRDWLVVLAEAESGGEAEVRTLQIFPIALVRECVSAILSGQSHRIREFLKPAVSLQGRPLVPAAPTNTESLGRVDAAIEDMGSANLHLALTLADPDALYAQQRLRAAGFAGLILAAAAAALIGFAAARRAFHRQVELGEAKSNFVASVSHELRAPIASIQLLAEGLERGTIRQPDKQHAYFTLIARECRRLSSLIENVLDFSRIETGARLYEFDPVDVVSLVVQAADLMRPAALQRQVRIVTEIDPALANCPPTPSLDGKAMQRALINLLDNATKHSPPNSTVTLRLTADGRSGSLLLSVEDQGEGIPAAEHDRIFDRFHRVGSELRRRTEGAGIGLSIVKHIVEAHHAKISVDSEPGKGARFVIELPPSHADQSR